MRTKTLLTAVAVLSAGITVSMAQSVFSVNSVGYVNKTLTNGYSLISNPLNATNSQLDTVLGTSCPDGTVVLKWDAVHQTFADPSQYYDGIGWLPPNTVAPGEGFFINVPLAPGAHVTVTFVGDVPQGNLTNRINGNYSLLSQIVPQTISLEDPSVSFPAQDGDIYLPWDPNHQTFGDPTQFYDGIGFLPYSPTPQVGEGFFYNTGAGAGRNWSRTFSVN